MAAPMASGALALALGEKLSVPPKELAEALKAQSFDLYAEEGNADDAGQLGEGRLDLAAFLEEVVKQNKNKGEAVFCEGVTRLTLRYMGSDSETIRVVQKDGKKVLFEGDVDPDDTFSFTGKKGDSAMGKEVELYEGGKKRGKLRTDCKKPIGPGLTEKNFEVVSGESLGGPLAPISKE